MMTHSTGQEKKNLPPPAELSLDTAGHVSGGSRAVELGGAIAAFVLSHMML